MITVPSIAQSQQQLLENADAARRKYSQSLQALYKAKVHYHDRAPELPQALLDNCRLLQNRQELVKLLPKEGVIAEIGTDRGLFARFMIETSRPRELNIFEIDTSRIDNDNIGEAVKKGTVKIHEGASADLMASMPDEYFDWIYVDGDHFYEGVKKDIEASAPKVKSGGYLVFNDYTTWSPTSMSKCGVARAVNEFCIKNDWELVFLAFQSMMYNDVAIRKRVR